MDHWHPKIYICDDARCTISRQSCIFDHGDVWMGGIGICRDQPLHIQNIVWGIGGRRVGGRRVEDAHTHGIDRCIVGRIQILDSSS